MEDKCEILAPGVEFSSGDGSKANPYIVSTN